MEQKTCTKCKQQKEICEFSFKCKSKELRRALCRSCVGELTKAHYANNKNRYKDTRRSIRRRNRQFIAEYLRDKACVDCGNTDPRVFEFDHVRGKKLRDISRMVTDCFSFKNLLKEIAKCEIRCANCHRIVSLKRSGHSKTYLCVG
jgi:hypothetical protein